MKFELTGTTEQQALLQKGLDRCTYPFDLATDVTIPVKFAPTLRTHNAWGLFWLAGRIEIDESLGTDPNFLAEVLLSEVAHAVDQYTYTPADRLLIAQTWHPSGPDEHTWFDSGPYSTWTGEAFMGLFVAAFSDIKVTLSNFAHQPTPETIALVQSLAPQRVPVPNPTPEPVSEALFVGCRWSKVFHIKYAHWYVCNWASWYSRTEAEAAGRRACKRCLPVHSELPHKH